ncbi:MAG TPA: PH domain-containing protein, partial [Candidatus Methylomirabilis sp.]
MRRVFRSTHQLILVTIMGILIPSMLVVEAITGPPSVSWRVRTFSVLLGVAIGWFLVFRVARTGLRVTEDGIEVLNILRRVSIPWQRIARFSIRSQWLLWESGRVELTD